MATEIKDETWEEAVEDCKKQWTVYHLLNNREVLSEEEALIIARLGGIPKQ